MIRKSDSEPRTETTLLDLARNPQMPDRALPAVSLGEIRDAIEQARAEVLEDAAEQVGKLRYSEPLGPAESVAAMMWRRNEDTVNYVLTLLSTKEEKS